MTCVLHLAEREHWEPARSRGTYDRSTRGGSVVGTGFVHASTSSQMSRVADAVYADVPASSLVLLVVDEEVLAAHGVEVRWENLDGGEELFPHLYGSLPAAAVTAELEVTLDAQGRFVLPDLRGSDVRMGPPA